MTDEQEYSGFKTRGTDIDDAFSDDIEMDTDVDDVDFEIMDDEYED